MDSIPSAEPMKRIMSKTTKLSIGKWEVECHHIRAHRRADLGPCRLSQCLQHNDCAILNTLFHPFTSPSLSPGKSSRSQLSSLNPSTLSSSTLNLSLFSNCTMMKQPGLHRSFSLLSSSSNPASLYPHNPWVQKMKRSESVAVPATYKRLKRSPSFGSNSNMSSLLDTMNIDTDVGMVVPPASECLEPHPAKQLRKQSHPMPPTSTPVNY